MSPADQLQSARIAPEGIAGQTVTKKKSAGAIAKKKRLTDTEYVVEDIRDRREVNGRVQYLVKWDGWPE